ncbi:hypothetical protein NQZ68_002629 [Dissostichus eleginoides]|nr:hypothetical protein NQZ68_002629 [Dissostichus eleginoides]
MPGYQTPLKIEGRGGVPGTAKQQQLWQAIIIIKAASIKGVNHCGCHLPLQMVRCVPPLPDSAERHRQAAFYQHREKTHTISSTTLRGSRCDAAAGWSRMCSLSRSSILKQQGGIICGSSGQAAADLSGEVWVGTATAGPRRGGRLPPKMRTDTGAKERSVLICAERSRGLSSRFLLTLDAFEEAPSGS